MTGRNGSAHLFLLVAGAALLTVLTATTVLAWPVSAQDNGGQSAPANLTVALSGDTVALNWEAPSADADTVTGYRILRRLPRSGEDTLLELVADTGTTATAYVDYTARKAGARYVYRVQAIRDGVVSKWSNSARIDLTRDLPEATNPPGGPVTPESGDPQGRGVVTLGHSNIQVTFLKVMRERDSAQLFIELSETTGKDIYLRYRPMGGMAWTELSTTTSSTERNFYLGALDERVEYEVQASLDDQFRTDHGTFEGTLVLTRPDDLDFDISSFLPTGIWSDETTMWFAYKSGTDIEAYKMSDMTRDVDKHYEDDDLPPDGTSTPIDLYSNGNLVWVLDIDTEKAFAFLADDLTSAPNYTLDPDAQLTNYRAGGIWGNMEIGADSPSSGTLWFSNSHESNLKAHAFDWTNSAWTYSSSKDISFTDGNGDPRGIWSDGDTMWVADILDDKLYAYDMDAGTRTAALDITVDDPGDLGQPHGVWSDGSVIWVSSQESGDIHAYFLPMAAVAAPEMTSVSRTRAEAVVPLTNPGSETVTGYLRYKPDTESDWANGTQLSSSGAANTLEFSLGGLEPNARYDVQVSLDETFSDETELKTTFTNRPAHEDFPLDAGQTYVTGIWGNETTLYVGDVHDTGTSDGKVYVYDRNTGALTTSHALNSITGLNISSLAPYGLWSDGTRLYAVDADDEVADALALSDFALDSTYSLNFDLLGVTSQTFGIWGQSNQLWVSNSAVDKVLAATWNGTAWAAETANDIGLDGHKAPRAIWSNGTTMWVADPVTDTLHAYKMIDDDPDPATDTFGDRDAANDISVDGNPTSLQGLWSDGDTIWVSEPSSDELSAYYIPDPPAPRASEIAMSDFTRTAATATVTISNPDTTTATEVYLRYRETGGMTWPTPAEETANSGVKTVAFDLTGLTANQDYEIEASLDETFSDGNEAQETFKVRPVHLDFTLGMGHINPTGLWADASKFYVGDYQEGKDDDGKVYVYDRVAGTLTTSHTLESITGVDISFDAPYGLWSDGTHLWAVDWNSKVAYALNLSDFSAAAAYDLDVTILDISASDTYGIWGQPGKLWISDRHLGQLKAATRSNNAWAAAATKDIGLHADNGTSRGIWSDGTAVWVVDNDDTKLYAYLLGGGSRSANQDVSLVADNVEPFGLWSDGDVVWVVDSYNHKLYAYYLPQSGLSVSSISFTSAPGTDKTYAIGDTVSATVTFTKSATVSTQGGKPQLELDIGGEARQAEYASGSGTTDLVFSYTVVEGDEADDGIAIGASKLTLNGGTILDGSDAAALTHAAVAADDSHKVDGVRPVLRDAEQDEPNARVRWRIVTLHYDEDIDDPGTTPTSTFTVNVNGSAATITDIQVIGGDLRLILSSSVAASDTVTVTYVVPATDPIRDLAGNAALALTDQAVTNVTPIARTVSSISFTSNPGADETYAVGDTIEATVTFSGEVSKASGDAALTLELDIGGTPRDAVSISGSISATTTVAVSYMVVAGDEDTDGISIGADKLDSSGLQGTESTTVSSGHTAVASDSGHKVDGVGPDLTGAEIDRTADDKALVLTYDETLDKDSAPDVSAFTVTVTVGGTESENVVTGVDVDGSKVTLTLTTAVGSTDTVTVDYAKPETEFLQDVQGNAAGDLSGESVTVRSGPPTVSIAADAETVSEGEAAAFTLSRTGETTAALAVTVNVTQDGDFTASGIDGTRTVTFGAGDATKALSFDTVDDTAGENDGSITVEVTAVPSGNQISATAATATVRVEDPDIKVVLRLAATALTVSESAGTVSATVVARMEPGVSPVDGVLFALSTVAGVAKGLEDYVIRTDALELSVSDFALDNGRWVARKTWAVTILDNDGVYEGDETFGIILERHPNNPRWEKINPPDGDETATVTIREDDAEPTLALSFNPPTVDEGDSTTLKVSSTNGVAFAEDQTITLSFGGTATRGTGNDYLVKEDGTTVTGDVEVTLEAGDTSVEAATIDVLDDTDVDEGYETVVVTATHGDRAFSRTLGLGAAPPGKPEMVRAWGLNGFADLLWTKPVWDGGTPVTHYEVQVKPDGEQAEDWKYLGPPGEYMTGSVDLDPGTYGFKVRAVNAVGAGPGAGPAKARVWAAQPQPEGAPSEPQSLWVNSSEGGRADLKWGRPASDGDAPTRGFRVETCLAACDDESNWSTVTADTGVGGTAVRFTWSHTLSASEVAEGLKGRWYRVSAVTEAGIEGPPSVPAQHPGSTLGELNAGNVSRTGATVWINLENPDGRDLFVGLERDGTLVETRTMEASNRSLGVVFEDLEVGTGYKVRVDFAAGFDSPAVREVGFTTWDEGFSTGNEGPFKSQTVEVSTDGGQTWGASGEIEVRWRQGGPLPGTAAGLRGFGAHGAGAPGPRGAGLLGGGAGACGAGRCGAGQRDAPLQRRRPGGAGRGGGGDAEGAGSGRLSVGAGRAVGDADPGALRPHGVHGDTGQPERQLPGGEAGGAGDGGCGFGRGAGAADGGGCVGA